MHNVIEDGRLKDVEQLQTPNIGFLRRPRFVVMHYTAGPSLDRAVENFMRRAFGASAHLVVGPDGRVVQLAPFGAATWHAGRSRWRPARGRGRIVGLTGLNKYSIGIEAVNAGPLRRTPKGRYLTWWDSEVPEDEVVEVDPQEPGSHGRRYWHRFPSEQIWTVAEVVISLFRHLPLEEVLGHHEISPRRKQDPGPAFPLEHIRSIITR